MLPEAAELVKGVSIDDYSTYRAHPVFGAGLSGQIRGRFSWYWGPLIACSRYKGGGGT